MPSLWTAVAGDRPVADAHDDPGHTTWGWKDALLGKCAWYYAKVLRKKATIISLEIAPYFYALSENYGSPEDDYLILYEQGRLTQESRQIYEIILAQGPIDTVALRKEAHMTSPESNSRFERALTELQADFKILPVGVTQAGAWRYAYAYDIVTRHFPDLSERAHSIPEAHARQKLVALFFRSVGVAQRRDVQNLFGWLPLLTQRTLEDLVEAKVLKAGLEVEGRSGEWIGLSELLS